MLPDPRSKTPAPSPDDEIPDEREGGMLHSQDFDKVAAAEAKAKEARRQAELIDGEAPPVDGDRMKQFKADARKRIEEELIAKRKKRRLLRGGDVSR